MDRIWSEIKILCKIFQYLNLKDLLVAAKVCTEFRNITNFILKTEYKNIEACKVGNYFIVHNKMENVFIEKLLHCEPEIENVILLNPNEFSEFLTLHAKNIQMLSLCLDEDHGEICLKRFKFDNLTGLCCKKILFTADDFQILHNFKNLTMLSLNSCLNENLLLSLLASLSNLELFKYLALTNTKQLDYKLIEKLINKLKLETCIINASIIGSTTKESNFVNENIKRKSYKELNIGKFGCEETFQSFHREILINVPHLTKLKLIATNNFLLMREFFTTLANYCPNLTFLSLERFNIKEFTPVFTLRELELKYCHGFTWRDLQTILNLMRLHTFTSYATRYLGNFEYFEIALTLKNISLHYNIVNNIKTLLSMNQERLKNIYSLKWSVDHSNHSWINATNCPNLKILMARPRNLIFENLQDFKFLKTLILNIDSGSIKDTDIIEILKHPTLNTLKINTINYDWITDAWVKGSSIQTNLLQINLNFYKTLIPFLRYWLNLLNINRKLSLKLYDPKESSCLESILCCNQHFPTHLKFVNVCGYIIDCSEIKCNYNSLIEKSTIVFENNRLNGKELYITL